MLLRAILELAEKSTIEECFFGTRPRGGAGERQNTSKHAVPACCTYCFGRAGFGMLLMPRSSASQISEIPNFIQGSGPKP